MNRRLAGDNPGDYRAGPDSHTTIGGQAPGFDRHEIALLWVTGNAWHHMAPQGPRVPERPPRNTVPHYLPTLGATGIPSGQSVSPTRFRFISKFCTAGLPAAMYSPTSRQWPPLMVAVKRISASGPAGISQM